jgi:hypothetical protein
VRCALATDRSVSVADRRHAPDDRTSPSHDRSIAAADSVPAGADRPRVGRDLCLDDIDGYAMAGEHAQIASDRHYTGRDRALGACDLSAATVGLALHVADPTQLFRDHVAIVVARAHAMPDGVTTARDHDAISIARKLWHTVCTRGGIRPSVGRSRRIPTHIMNTVRRPIHRSAEGGRERRMNRSVRRRLEMAVRARNFCRARPSADNTSYEATIARLEAAIAQMETAAQQQEGGFRTRRSSVARRKDLRRRLQHELIRHVVTVAEDAAREQPSLAEHFRLPKGNEPNKTFLTVANKMLEQGRANRDVLLRHGMADKLLDDLAAAIGELEASIDETSDGLRSHVGASAELEAVSDEVMRLVEVLDGFNRYRFSGDADLLAEWENARHVVAGPRAKVEPADGTPTQPTTPTGEVRPAA